MNAAIPSSLPFECTSPRLMKAASPSAKGDPLVVIARNPTTASKGEEDLAKARLVWADDATRLKVDDIRVRFAFPLGHLDRGGEFHVVRPPAGFVRQRLSQTGGSPPADCS